MRIYGIRYVLGYVRSYGVDVCVKDVVVSGSGMVVPKER